MVCLSVGLSLTIVDWGARNHVFIWDVQIPMRMDNSRFSDDAVASSVYINPDWSPAERKLAYAQRQQRRVGKQTRVKTAQNTGVAAAAESDALPTSPVNTPFQPVDIP